MKHTVVNRQEWIEAQKAHLKKEKELMRQADQLKEELRALPWVKVDKAYTFQGKNGKVSLADLFGNNSQLIVYHFMFAPGWEEGCIGCSFLSDHVDGGLIHLENHDVSFAAISRAPYPEIQAYKKRMEWQFNWVSSFETSFNYDFNVSFTPEQLQNKTAMYNFVPVAEGEEMEEQHGISVFYKDDSGDIFHTYSSYGRGNENIITTYHFLDMTPKGRNEKDNLTDWVKRHDQYGNADQPASCCAGKA